MLKALGVVPLTGITKGQVTKPFPENRIRDFYAGQARHYLGNGAKLPKILPEFPGLDGGSFGYWGQNPEADNYDYGLNEMDKGPVVSQVTNHFRKRTHRAIITEVPGDRNITTLFDAEKLTFTEAWEGGFVKWASRRYGITSPVTQAGKQILSLGESGWSIPEGVERKFLGHYRAIGPTTVFSYQIGGCRIDDHLFQVDKKVIRFLDLKGKLPNGIKLKIRKGNLVPTRFLNKGQLALDLETGTHYYPAPPQFQSLGDTPHFREEHKVTQGYLIKGKSKPYAIDTLTVPYRDANPFKSPMRLSGLDFFEDGRAAVCNLMGDVWIVDGISSESGKLTWRRFAAGLNNPGGLVIHEDKIHVICRDQLVRLHDRSGNGEADFYECLTNDFPIGAGNNWALTLHADPKGRFYWFTRASGFDVTMFDPASGKPPQSIGNGLVNDN